MFIHKPTGLKFKTKPWKHQLEALKFLMNQGFGALYTDMGSGKTKVMVDLINNAGYKKTLIVAPKKVCRVWPKEFLIHSLDPNICVLNVSNFSGERKCIEVNKRANLDEKIVIVVNYDSVWREPFRSLVLKTKWDACICDESHRIKTPSAKCSRMLALMTTRVPHRYMMTGTPLAQNPTDTYAQYKYLEPSIFGTRYDKFCDRYENVDLYRTARAGYTVLDEKQPYKNLDELREKMFSVAFNCQVELDLPEQHHITVEYDVPSKIQNYYKHIKKHGVLSLEQGTLTVENILSLTLRFQQLLDGYIPVLDDDMNETMVKVDDERVRVLQELIEGLGDEPVVVFARFRKDFSDIREMLDSVHITHSEVSGAADTYEEWREGKTQVLLVQPQSGSEGLDMTRSRYAIYYSKHPSLALYKQSLKRIHRPGQNRPCTYFHIIGKMSTGNSVDETIMKAHQLNMEIVDYVMNNKNL